VDLEFHQLDLRYERLRVRQPAREQRLLASLADAGQQVPIVVVPAPSIYIVVDGHKRVRCLHRLHRDTVAAVIWEMAEGDALIFRHLLQTDGPASVFEQAWLLRTLHEDHRLALDVLARRFDRSVSWVSRRLSLVRTLPDVVQQHVRDGHVAAHAAMKYLVPLARATPSDGIRFAETIAPHRLSTRQVGRLYQHYVEGAAETRALVLTDPLLVLRMTDDTAPARIRPEASAPEALLSDLHVLGAVARRAARRLHHGGGLLPFERARAWRLFEQVRGDFGDLQGRCEQELRDARSESPDGHLAVTGEGLGHPADCPRVTDRTRDRPGGVASGHRDGATA
jgi:ParB/RepB/Spo0J family partition protein